MRFQPARADADVLQTRFGLRLAGLLNRPEASLPHDVEERLRVARGQALQRAGAARRAAPAAPPLHLGQAGGTALLGQALAWWQRLAIVLPLLVLVLGLIAIDRAGEQEKLRDAADFDVVLLSDDLPVLAYADPGFVEYLKTAQP